MHPAAICDGSLISNPIPLVLPRGQEVPSRSYGCHARQLRQQLGLSVAAAQLLLAQRAHACLFSTNILPGVLGGFHFASSHPIF
jgi:hypothetical protein